MGGWEGDGVGSGGKLGAVGGLSKHSNTNGSAEPSVGDPDWHNSHGRPGLPLETFLHPMQSY